MLIALDLDDVLADTLNAMMVYHNSTYKTTFKREDFISYKWEEVWGGTRQEGIAKFLEFSKTPAFAAIPPVPGALSGISFLKQHHTLVIITSRQQELITHTTEWVDKHFPGVFQDVHLTNHPHWATSGKTKTKREVCDELGVDVLIEDNLDYATECVTEKRKIFILETPWNRTKTNHPNIHHVSDWSELLRHPLFHSTAATNSHTSEKKLAKLRKNLVDSR